MGLHDLPSTPLGEVSKCLVDQRKHGILASCIIPKACNVCANPVVMRPLCFFCWSLFFRLMLVNFCEDMKKDAGLHCCSLCGNCPGKPM